MLDIHIYLRCGLLDVQRGTFCWGLEWQKDWEILELGSRSRLVEREGADSTVGYIKLLQMGTQGIGQI